MRATDRQTYRQTARETMGVDHGAQGTSPPEFGAGALSPRFCHVAKF